MTEARIAKLEAEVAFLLPFRARAEVAETRVKELEAGLRKTVGWAESRCPCVNDEPNPCPLCGASVENLEVCKSAENTLPRQLLIDLRALLSPKDKSNG